MDSKRAQANPHHDGNLQHDGDVVVLEPKDWTDAEEALSKLAHVASDRRHLKAGSDFAAGPRVTEPSLDRTFRPADPDNDRLPTDRSSPGRRKSHGLARFLVAACVGVATTLAWQSYGAAARQMIASAVPQLGWLLLSPPATNPPSDGAIAVAQPSLPAAQASVPQAAPAQAAAVAPTETETAASTAPTGASPELQQQLEAMMQDLAAVRQSIEQLAAGQEQMVRDIAKLHTAGQDIRRRISAVPPAPSAATITAHKPVPPTQPAPQASTAPLPLPPPQPAPQSSGAPLPPAPSDPPRPPMPVLR